MQTRIRLERFRNIGREFHAARRTAVAAMAVMGVVAATAVIGSRRLLRDQMQSVYVISGEEISTARRTDVGENREAEARGHVRTFHELFFTLVPDPSAIRENMRRALCLADNSAFDHYMDLREKGYYDRIVSGGIVQRIAVDSIVCRMDRYPYTAVTHAREFILRQHTVTERRLETECMLENTVRSDDNPHGFMIRRLTVVRNDDIGTMQR